MIKERQGSIACIQAAMSLLDCSRQETEIQAPNVFKNLSGLSPSPCPARGSPESSCSVSISSRAHRRQHETGALAKADPEAIALAKPAQSHCVAIL